MKESGMDKLIELRCLIKPLEEYLLELAKKNPLYANFNVNLPGVSILGVHETILISKKFGFIQWLVENDKIDLEEYNNKSGLYTLKVVCGTDYFIDLKTNKVNSDFLLMLLSIQDNPIEFLCEILK